jgi:hypothetical protein
MSSAIAFVASFVSILIGTAVGMILKRSLPPELLDLAKYGPAAKAARNLLRETIPSATNRIWQERPRSLS